MKRLIGLIFLFILIIPSISLAENNVKIKYLVEKGWVSGDAGTGNLRLEDPINRAEVAKMVVVAQGNEEVAKSLHMLNSKFKDMDSNNWSNGYVNVAAVKGLIDGYPDNTFIPNNDITYAEVITIMVRVLGGLSKTNEVYESWEVPYINEAIELGILDEIEIIDYKEKAIREKVFEIVYNTIIIQEDRNYRSYKGMVVKTINALQVEIRLIDSEDKETLTVAIPRRLGDTTNLLGKVIDISIDKDNYVRELSLDNSYSYIYGTPTFDKDSVLINHRRYGILDPVVLHNDENAIEPELGFSFDFVRGTVKDRQLVFLDSYTFNSRGIVNGISKDGLEVLLDDEGKRVKINPENIISYTRKHGFRKVEIKDLDISDQIYFYGDKSIIVGIEDLINK